MMGADAGETNNLLKCCQFVLELCRREAWSIVHEEGGWNNTNISACQLELFFGLESLVRCQVLLIFDMHKARGVVNKQASAHVHIRIRCSPFRA